MARSKVKITVLKRVDPSVIFDGDVPNMPGTDKPYTVCSAFEEGQEFVVGLDGNRPEGFCGWAWRDVYKDVCPSSGSAATSLHGSPRELR